MISAMSGKLAQDSLTAAGGVEAIALHLISGDSNTRGAAALALAHLTSNVEGVAEEQPVAAQAALVKAGAIGTLVSSLSHETDWTLLEATIHALYNALVLCEPAQDALVDAGGVEALSLQLNDVRLSKKARSAVLLTLRALSSLARVKEAVLDAGTIDALAAFAAANRDDEVVQQETFNALYELAQARAHASPSHTVLALSLFELPHKPPAPRLFNHRTSPPHRRNTTGMRPKCERWGSASPRRGRERRASLRRCTTRCTRSNGNGAPPPLRSSAARLPVRGLRRTRAASFRPPASARSSPWLSPGGAPRRGGSRRARASGTLESERRRAERQRQREAEG